MSAAPFQWTAGLVLDGEEPRVICADCRRAIPVDLLPNHEGQHLVLCGALRDRPNRVATVSRVCRLHEERA